MDIKLTDTILSVSERIAIKTENCDLEDVYKKWILKKDLHLPGWISFYLTDEFLGYMINNNNTIKEMFDEYKK